MPLELSDKLFSGRDTGELFAKLRNSKYRWQKYERHPERGQEMRVKDKFANVVREVGGELPPEQEVTAELSEGE